MKNTNRSISTGNNSFIWRETFAKGKGAIIVQLSQKEIEKAVESLEKSANFDDLAQITLTSIHEPKAHGINSKSGLNPKDDLEEHNEFNGKKAQAKADPTGKRSPAYKDIDPKSPSGKYKDRIEIYIRNHKTELLKMMEDLKKKESKNNTNVPKK